MFSVSRFVQGFCKKIVTLGPIGYQIASGTLGTLCSVPLAYICSSSFTLFFSVIFLLTLALCLSFPLFENSDPSEIVIDEVIGFIIAMFGIATYGWIYALGFVLFRFFDITKYGGIRLAERLPGWIGVVMDDVVAGVYTNLLLRLCFYFLF